MNDKIRELAIEAGYDMDMQQHQKFAELLIRECCDMVNKHLQRNNPNDCLLVLNIKERFGIES
jgi:hypothetical protein